jgi:hypothetical protein
LGGLNSKQNTASALIESASSATKNIATSDSPAAKRQATAAAKRQALLDFLHAQDAASLVQKLLDAADDDRALMAELKNWQAQVALSAQLAEQAREAKAGQAAKTTKARNAAWREPLAELLKKRADFYHWSNIGTYIRSADKALAMLREIAKIDAAQGREACGYAMGRLFAVAAHTDDSSGSMMGVMQEVAGLLCDCLRKAPLSPQEAKEWTQDWFKLMAQDPWGVWDEAAVLAAAGVDVQAAYSKQAAKDWEDCVAQLRKRALTQQEQKAEIAQLKRQPKKTPEQRRQLAQLERGVSDTYGRFNEEQSRLNHQRWVFLNRYLRSLELCADTPALYALHQQATDSQLGAEAYDWIRLVEWCNKNGRQRETLRWVQAGLKAYPDDARLSDALLACYERDGYDQEALTMRRAALEKSPSVEHYDQALKAAQRAGLDRAAYREELYAWLEQRELDWQAGGVSRLWTAQRISLWARCEHAHHVVVARWLAKRCVGSGAKARMHCWAVFAPEIS